MTTTTNHNRFLIAAMAIAPAIIVLGYAWPVHAVMTQVEIASAFGLAASGLLFAIGAYNIAEWRRKRRDWLAFIRACDEKIMRMMRVCDPGPLPTTLEEALDNGWTPVEGTGLVIYPDGRSEPRLPPGWSVEQIPGPATVLQRHLTDALAVLQREPSLTIDAGTLRMLAKHKAKAAPVRGEGGRWVKVQ